MSDSIHTDEGAKPKKGIWLNLLKWLWMLLVLLAFAGYLWRNFGEIASHLSQFPPQLLLLSLCFVMLGRLLFIGLSSELLVLLGYPKPYRNVFYLASTTELGKYLPGGIWHLVGRAGYFRQMGLPLAMVSRMLLQENAWAAVSAAMVGLILLVLAYTQAYWAIGVLGLCWWLILLLWGKPGSWQRISLQLILHTLIWLVLSYSFTMLLPSQDNFGLLLSMAALCLSWLLGFVSFFAPGGLGVREAALIAFLSPLMPASEIFAYALVHRLLWVLVELLYSLIAWVFFDLGQAE